MITSKKKLKSIFSSDTEKSNASEFQIKAEPTYYTKETTSDEEDYDNKSNYDIADTYYTQEKYRRPYTNKHKPQYQNMKQRQNSTQKLSSNSRSMPQKPTKGRNPQKNGQTTRLTSVRVLLIGLHSVQIRILMNSVAWSMKLSFKIVVIQAYKPCYLKHGLLLFLTLVLLVQSVEGNGLMYT